MHLNTIKYIIFQVGPWCVHCYSRSKQSCAQFRIVRVGNCDRFVDVHVLTAKYQLREHTIQAGFKAISEGVTMCKFIFINPIYAPLNRHSYPNSRRRFFLLYMHFDAHDYLGNSPYNIELKVNVIACLF